MALVNGCGGGSGGGEESNPPPPTGMNAPTATNACITIARDAVHTGMLPASDQDGQPLTFEILSQPTKSSEAIAPDSAGNYRYTPRPGVQGMDQFTFRARDSTGRESGIATVTLFIGGALRIMPLGDSITVGTYTSGSPAPGSNIGYRKKLFSDLTASANGRYTIDFVGSLQEGQAAGIGDPDHEGHGGATSNEIANGRPAGSSDPGFPGVIDLLNLNPPDVILLHIGTNNFTTDASDVTTILDRISAWESTNYPVWVFVARIIQTATGSLDVETFNDNVERVVASRGNNRLVMVNQQTGAGLIYSVGADMADNLHPNQSGYDKMATRWRSDLLAANVLPACPP